MKVAIKAQAGRTIDGEVVFCAHGHSPSDSQWLPDAEEVIMETLGDLQEEILGKVYTITAEIPDPPVFPSTDGGEVVGQVALADEETS